MASIRTTARRVGDDYVINGAKCWITNGTRADFITLAVRTGEEGYGGISLVLFPTDDQGLQGHAQDQEGGQPRLATPPSSRSRTAASRARYLLGEENHGFYYIMMNFQGERLIAAVKAVAGAQYALDNTISYTQERSAFGRPILKFQVWRHTFAELATEIEAARWLTYRAVRSLQPQAGRDQGDHHGQAVRRRAAQQGRRPLPAGARRLRLLRRVPASRAPWRDARLITIGGGTSEIMKEILSKRLGWG